MVKAYKSVPFGDFYQQVKVDLKSHAFRDFSHAINFWIYLSYYINHIWSFLMYVIIPIFSFLLQVYYFGRYCKLNNLNDVLFMFEPLCTLIHILWNLNFWITIMWSLSKANFHKLRFCVHNIFFDMIKCMHVYNSLNHAPNPFKMQHMNEISKLKKFDLFSIYFFTMWEIGKFCKVDWK